YAVGSLCGLMFAGFSSERREEKLIVLGNILPGLFVSGHPGQSIGDIRDPRLSEVGVPAPSGPSEHHIGDRFRHLAGNDLIEVRLTMLTGGNGRRAVRQRTAGRTAQ